MGVMFKIKLETRTNQVKGLVFLLLFSCNYKIDLPRTSPVQPIVWQCHTVYIVPFVASLSLLLLAIFVFFATVAK
jgi:hypothetical protein